MIPRMTFGRTEHISSRTIFGGFALEKATQEEADRILDLLLEHGVNHIDTAASYGDSELRIGPWMDRYREHFFLATKTEKRTYQEAKEELHRSLDRLQTDHVDLWQMHLLIDPEEWKVAMEPGGALEAFVEARDEGLVRYLGVTGHNYNVAEIHRKSLERFDFDSVLLPYNYEVMQHPKYATNFAMLMDICRERNVAVQTIKVLAQRPWREDEDREGYHTWYKPFTEQEEIDTAVHWALCKPDVFLDTSGDINLLPKILDAARRFDGNILQEYMGEKLKEKDLEPIFPV